MARDVQAVLLVHLRPLFTERIMRIITWEDAGILVKRGRFLDNSEQRMPCQGLVAHSKNCWCYFDTKARNFGRPKHYFGKLRQAHDFRGLLLVSGGAPAGP